VANVQLESAPDNTPLRLEQLNTVLTGLKGSGHSIIMGDFNLDPIQQAEESLIQARYREVWEKLSMRLIGVWRFSLHEQYSHSIPQSQ
jgi:endonuclease/exonuclease/phosphatase family metal-dependent hydrolase